MRNLTCFGVGLLVSVVVLTGFGHRRGVVLLGVSGMIVLAVKNFSTRYGRVWYLGGMMVGVASVLISLISYTDDERLVVTPGSVIQARLLQFQKPDTVVVSVTTDSDAPSTLLVQSESVQGLQLGDEVLFEVDRVTLAQYPSLVWTGPLIWHPQEFDYSRRLAMKGIDGHVQTSSVMSMTKTGLIAASDTLPIKVSLMSHLRMWIGETYTPQTAGLLEGMLVGGRAGLGQREYDSFVQSGLVHIIAVSGSNIMMVVVLLGVVLFRVPLYVRIVLIGGGVVGYSILAGLDSSVLRAMVMGVTLLLTLVVGRRMTIWRSVWYAAIILLVTNPWTLMYDLGFTLSFGALIGIVTIDRAVRSYQLPLIVRTYLLPSVGAALGTFPVLIMVMGSFPLLSPLINIIVVPRVPVVLLLGVVGLLVGGWIVWITEGLVGVLFAIAQWGSSMGGVLEVETLLSKLMVVMVVCGVILIISSCLSVFFPQERSVNG